MLSEANYNELTFKVVDVQGKLLEAHVLKSMENSLSINTAAYANGLYSILIYDANGNRSQFKFAVKH